MALDGSMPKEDCRTKFQYLASRFASLVHGRSEGDRQQINLLLDELNALDFKSPMVVNLDVGQFLFTAINKSMPDVTWYSIAASYNYG
jgi:hypothetical protein